VLQRNGLSAYKDFLAIAVVVLATDFAPPFVRILGSKTWTSLGITESQWSIVMASRGLFFIIFILAAGVLGDLYGRLASKQPVCCHLCALGYLWPDDPDAGNRIGDFKV
jgi:MFS family permease